MSSPEEKLRRAKRRQQKQKRRSPVAASLREYKPATFESERDYKRNRKWEDDEYDPS